MAKSKIGDKVIATKKKASNFGISNNPNYVGDWYGEGQIDYSEVINKNGKGDLYMLKLWSGSGYILDVYLVKANDEYDAMDRVFEWSYKNEGANKIVFDGDYLSKQCRKIFKKEPNMFGEGLSDDYDEFEMRFFDEYYVSSDNGFYARSENFFLRKVDNNSNFACGGKNFSIKETLFNGGILMF